MMKRSLSCGGVLLSFSCLCVMLCPLLALARVTNDYIHDFLVNLYRTYTRSHMSLIKAYTLYFDISSAVIETSNHSTFEYIIACRFRVFYTVCLF